MGEDALDLGEGIGIDESDFLLLWIMTLLETVDDSIGREEGGNGNDSMEELESVLEWRLLKSWGDIGILV